MAIRRGPTYQKMLKDGRDEVTFLNGPFPAPSKPRNQKKVPTLPEAPVDIEAQKRGVDIFKAVTNRTIKEYLEHEKSLREYEGEKLNRLEIMAWAQRTRTRFVGLSMQDRKVFLDVLTADENKSISHMLSLQHKLEAEGIDDNILAIGRAGGDGYEREIIKARKTQKTQKKLSTRRQRLLSAAPDNALPAGRVLALGEGHD
jgi:hypothetical protein